MERERLEEREMREMKGWKEREGERSGEKKKNYKSNILELCNSHKDMDLKSYGSIISMPKYISLWLHLICTCMHIVPKIPITNN